ncbi:hypothetical protein [uncultured Roseibium sp.]|uniref:hypothetical protein n=1 Tax=uncultured Roseibium sp. TaxID=1936171 RepID=UPI0026145703|nr:hypothetical protein [uncultured Roseibium sp.]
MEFEIEKQAAEALGEMLTTEMQRAYENPLGPRTWFYGWERRAAQWLIAYRERHPGASVGNDWVPAFLELNKEAIMSEGVKIDFNLREDRLRKLGL